VGLLFLVTPSGAATISNMWLKESARGVVVGYDLDAEKPVPVRLVGSKDGGRTYDLKVESVSGAVGPRVSPGKGKRIVWAVSKDYPKGIDDLDVVLDVIIDRASAQSAEEQTRPKGPVYFVIPFRGEVGKEIQKVVIARCLVEAARLKPDAVVLEIDSPGGLISELYQLVDLISTWQKDHPDQLVVAVVPEQALSAAAIFAMACRKIYMMPGSVIGAAMAINVKGGKVTGVAEKFSSVYRGKARAAVETAGHEPLLAEAMIDPDIELSVVREPDGEVSVARGSPKTLQATGDGSPKLLVAGGKLLTLTASEAVECGLAEAVVDDYDAIGKHLGLDRWVEHGTKGRRIVARHGAEVERVQTDFEDLVFTINEMIEKVRTSSGRQLSALESNIWEVRSSLDELDEMAHQYPFMRSRLYASFKKGTEPLRRQCDKALRKIKEYKLQRSRSRRRR
jgi:ATP-dependent protease ClpP protease subunit